MEDCEYYKNSKEYMERMDATDQLVRAIESCRPEHLLSSGISSLIPLIPTLDESRLS